MNEIPINHFNRAKPFYPLIMSYLLQLHGMKELAVRGIMGSRTDEEFFKAFSGKLNDGDSEQKIRELRANCVKFLGPLELRSEFQNNRITSDADEVSRELVGNFSYLMPYFIKAAGFLLVLAHEVTKDKSYRDKGPLWEFLRHCRNAATHNGKFHFLDKEPKRPAIWGPFEIERKLQGSPLFKNEQGYGMLSLGDPIRLLWDIEQAYPNMKVE